MLRGLTLPKKLKTNFSEINVLDHLQYNYFFQSAASLQMAGPSIEVKNVFTHEKFSVLVFKIHNSKKSYRNIE